MVFALFACRLDHSGLFAYKSMLDRACLNKEWVPGHFGGFWMAHWEKGRPLYVDMVF